MAAKPKRMNLQPGAVRHRSLHRLAINCGWFIALLSLSHPNGISSLSPGLRTALPWETRPAVPPTLKGLDRRAVTFEVLDGAFHNTLTLTS